MGTDTSQKALAQTAQILAHLTRHGSITPMEALHKYGCFRLGARIWDLRQRGIEIDTQNIRFTSKAGNYGRHAKYVIRKRD